MVNKKQTIVRLIVIASLFWGGYSMLSIFFNAFIYKIRPPIRLFPQFYFAIGYFFVGVGIYLLIITIMASKKKGQAPDPVTDSENLKARRKIKGDL